MRQVHGIMTRRLITTAALVWVAVISSVAVAETATVTYVLEDVWLLPDDSHPGWGARQMSGVFEWTYEVGDFEG